MDAAAAATTTTASVTSHLTCSWLDTSLSSACGEYTKYELLQSHARLEILYHSHAATRSVLLLFSLRPPSRLGFILTCWVNLSATRIIYKAIDTIVRENGTSLQLGGVFNPMPNTSKNFTKVCG